jgi:hypothetical protein
MKKTFLLIAALIIGATSANAQRFISADAFTVKNKAVQTKAKLNQIIKGENTKKAKDGTPVISVNFSDDTQYQMVVLNGHTAGENQGKFRRLDTTASSTAILQSTYPEFYDWFGISTYGYYYVGNNIGKADPSGYAIGDGYAIVAPLDIYYADGGSSSENVKVYNTAIKCVEPIVTTDFNCVQVVFNQYTQRFNSDRYFIDYTTDPSWSTYDSIEFNIKGVELNSNNATYGEKKVTLPVNSTINRTIYIRLRYYCAQLDEDNRDLPSGYFWLVDEINVYNGPEYGLDVISTYHGYAAYHVVPQGLTMDTLKFFATVDNAGGKTLYGALAEERYHTVDLTQDPEVYTFLNQTNVSASPKDISVAMRVDTVYDDNDVISELNNRRQVSISASSARINNNDLGYHALSSGLKYLQVQSGTDYTTIPMEDTIIYNVVEVPDTTENTAARWASDYDALLEGRPWMYGLNGSYLDDECPGAYMASYEVCNRFITPIDLPENTWYFKGVEVVPAADSCVTGMRIQASLKYYNFAATAVENLILPVLKDDTAVVSDYYTVHDYNLNNGVFEDADYSATRTYNSIFMPFVKGGIALEPDMWYYACYKLIDDGKFLVGRDDWKRVNTFKPNDYNPDEDNYNDRWSKIVYSPASTHNYTWGYPYGVSYSNYNSPMIRAKVSHKYGSMSSLSSDITTPSFNLNAYPNPAQEEAIVEYTLNTNGNVVITLTDIIGRNVLTMNRGNQGANTTYRVALNTNNLNNGTYFYTLNVNGVKQTKKLVINK